MVNKERIAALSEHLFSSWNYISVLALALATAESTRFTTDLSRWNQVIFELKKQNPALFGDVFFDIDDPWPPHSQQIKGFLATMRRSGAFTMWISAGKGEYEMTRGAKADLINKGPTALKDQIDVLKKMAQEVDERLGIGL